MKALEMKAPAPRILALAIAAALAFCLVGCQNSQPSDTQGQESAPAAPAYSEDEIRQTLDSALSTGYSNVTFLMESVTKSTFTGQSGAQQQSSVKSTMSGELDNSGDQRHMHMNMSTSSSNGSTDTAFELFVQGDEVVIVQDGQTFADSIARLGLESTVDSINSLITPEAGTQMLDIAKDMKMEKRDAETAITIVTDPSQLSGDEVNTGAEDNVSANNTLTSLVIVYTIDSSNHVGKISMTGGATSGASYHVRQTYTFTNYDATEVPPMPEAASATPSIQVDESGRQFVEDTDGTRYYLAEDGNWYSLVE